MGKDLESFVTALPAWLHCPVCLEAAYPPLLVCAEQHIVCQACVGDILASERGTTCPTCRRAMAKRVEVSPLAKRAFDEYKYRCRDPDCDWVGSVAEEEDHARNTCLQRKVICRFCAELVTLRKQEDHVRAECPNATIACPRGGAHCGGPLKGMLKRRELDAHEKICAEWPCRASQCTTRTTLVNRPAHELWCLNACMDLQNLRRDVRSLESRNVRLAAEVEALKQQQGGGGARSRSPRQLVMDLEVGPLTTKRSATGASQ
ncbi:uncharacterized protein JCM10292_006167 [Rhodotorula paludigena]|uniref:uncharacterized protein n=1 Tax=Rhodotorula paludigena TaxID=86838 RepID=UPI003172B3CC